MSQRSMFVLAAIVIGALIAALYQAEQAAIQECHAAGGVWTKVGEDLVLYPNGSGGTYMAWVDRHACVTRRG